MNTVFNAIPENPFQFEDGVVFFSVNLNTFYRICFGTGDNLTDEDINAGYDDYLVIDVYKWDGERPLLEVIDDIKDHDGYIDEIDGLEEEDGGMMLVRRSDYNNNGCIRAYLENALDYANYGADKVENLYKDLIFITATN